MAIENDNVVYVVHSIDTEGPLYESLDATFERLEKHFGINLTPSKSTLEKIQQAELDLGGVEKQLAKAFSPELLSYIDNYGKLEQMLETIGSESFRNKLPDSYGGGWIYNWHCVDHVGYNINPRKKDIGFHNIFDYYSEFIRETDAPDNIHWHFHPTHHRGISHLNVNTYLRDNKIFETIARRIIERDWFPSVNRAGYHTERPDSHWFLEQWMPFDLSNQAFSGEDEQIDLSGGRFGDWRRAPDDWSIYKPAHDDYQLPGNCRRYIARCLNVGTRMRCINENEVRKAFRRAKETGSAIMGFTNHDSRDMAPDVNAVRELIKKVSPEFPDVKFKYCDVREAFNRAIFNAFSAPKDNLLKGQLEKTSIDGQLKLTIEAREDTFGPQPFLAVETVGGEFHHDNFDFQEPFRKWTYVFDEHTFPIDTIKKIGVASNDKKGFYHTIHFEP
jgi:hypothetical protein